MSKSQTSSNCTAIPTGLLTIEELRKFNHHVRRNRGELLFAKCWLLVEGETDVSVFAECADLLDIDRHRKGIRVIEYSQAGGAGIFIKVADVLGIDWHLVADNDQSGEKYAKEARDLLNGRHENNQISKLSSINLDVLMCCHGYGQPYRKGVGPKKEVAITEPIDSVKYWEQVYRIINTTRGFSKPAAALESILLMKAKGANGVPDEIKNIIAKVTSQIGGVQ
jgi:putative ATP-dependent endonuclease of OLD family